MSKAFTKDDSAPGPLLVPPRAPLPAGVPNYVTARGLELLRAELAELKAERARLAAAESDASDRPQRLAINGERMKELSARVASATVVDPRESPQDEVRFGATVTVRSISGDEEGAPERWQIVGVDEADAANGRVAFTAPIARALMGLHVGDTGILHLARGEEELEVLAITYE